jgi:hypothetical protein
VAVGNDWVNHVSRALSDQVRPWLPGSITVGFESNRLTLTADPPGWAIFDFAVFSASDDDVATQVARAVLALLDFVQDFRAHHTAQPWPIDSSGRMALPNSRAEHGVVTGWFGDEREGDGPSIRVDLTR